MIDPDSEEHQSRRRLPMLHGRRTRVLVAVLGCLFSFGVPIAALSTPTLAVDQQTVRSPEDQAGLSTTGVLPADPPAGDGALAAGLPAGEVSGTAPDVPAELPGIPTPPDLPDGPLGIPGTVLDAYQFAERTLAEVRPGCHLSWSILAGIGRIESNHASDGRVDAFGNTLGPILGPQLDGSPGVAAIPDTDQGVLDGDTTWDRAVGPMQFIPSTWRSFGVDGNGDGVTNPNNIYDSTVTTGLYLCAAGADLSDPAQLQAAVFRYNHSATYVDVVLRWAHAYVTGVIPVPSASGPVPPGTSGNGGRLLPPAPAPPVPVPPAPSAAAQAVPPLATTSAAPTPAPLVATPAPAPSLTPVATLTPVTTPTPPAAPTTAPEPTSGPSESPSPSGAPSLPVATPTPTAEATATPAPSALPSPSATPSPLPAGP